MKVGDWGYHNFNLVQIKTITDGRITEITDGNFGTAGSNLKLFPLNIRNKVISEEFTRNYRKINDISGLNYPDIFSYFVDRWEECCEDEVDLHVRLIYQKIYDFVNNIECLVDQRKITKVHDVDIFR